MSRKEIICKDKKWREYLLNIKIDCNNEVSGQYKGKVNNNGLNK